MNQSVEDALWRKYRREKRSMTEWNALLGAIRDEAEKRGWSLFVDRQLVQFVDTRDATFLFPYGEIIADEVKYE